jgi:twitching motility protein PilT
MMYHRRMMSLDEILRLAVEKNASDVHLKVGVPPVIRRNGSLRPISKTEPPLTNEDIFAMARSIMDASQWDRFEKDHSIDLSYGIAGIARFRLNVFRQRGTIHMVIRNVPYKVPTFEELHLPPAIAKLGELERGLVLITGVAGSGKSSTLAALINDINQRHNKHILTIEDPIEFLIRDHKSLVTQREIGIDAHSFSEALRSGLRQDPDVILIGEMRDLETIEIALLAAETGHLVLSTLHTLDASETINRILSAFDSARHQQVRLQLGSVLRAVISQRLCRRKEEESFVPAVEILINNARVREMIESAEKTAEISSVIEASQNAWGMQSFDQSLMELLDKGLITMAEALLHSSHPEDFKVRVAGIMAMDGKNWSREKGAGVDQESKDWQTLTEVEIDLPPAPEQPVMAPKKKKSS